MGRASASVLVVGRVSDAEELFYTPARRVAWWDGFGHVIATDGAWPSAGASLTWTSPPGGRGPVREKMVELTPREGSTIEVEDEKLTGIQTVAFSPAGDQVRVTVSLEFRLKDSTPLTPLVGFFVRRSKGEELRRSLARFARERAADAELL